MPGWTRRSATGSGGIALTPQPPLPTVGDGEQAIRLPSPSRGTSAKPMFAPRSGGAGGEGISSDAGDLSPRQPALLPSLAAPSTTLPARPRRRRGALGRVTGVA